MAISYTFPESVLIARKWPQGILPSTTVIFLNGAGCQFLAVGNIYIVMHYDSGHPYIPPSQYEPGIFGDMLHLTTTVPSRVTSTLCMRMIGYILPSVDIQVHSFEIHWSCRYSPSTLVFAARDAQGPTSPIGTYNYFSYVGNHQYCFEFIVACTRDIIRAGIMLGCLTIRIEVVPIGGALAWMASTTGQ